MKRTKAIIPILVGVGFGLALLAGLRWSAEPMFRPPQGLSSGSEADLIRDRYPRRLVDPSSLGVDDDEVMGEWFRAEIKARLTVVSISLGALAALAVTCAYFVGKQKSANQLLHRTQ